MANTEEKSLFTEYLEHNREGACQLLIDKKVNEWMNDGIEEVKRVLTNWLVDRMDLSNDKLLEELWDAIDADEIEDAIQ